MTVGDMPLMASSAYGTNAAVFNLANNGAIGLAGGLGQLGQQNNFKAFLQQAEQNNPPNIQQEKVIMAAQASRRLVQVFIADPDENIPLEQSLLYSGEQKLTDATDQELFFEVDIKTILEKHNAERVKLVNKKVKERTEYLDPAKIRDLKMVVVNVATF